MSFPVFIACPVCEPAKAALFVARCVRCREREVVVEPPDHAGFVEARATGFKAMRRSLAKRAKAPPHTPGEPKR